MNQLSLSDDQIIIPGLTYISEYITIEEDVEVKI
ncbi:alkylated DNA repair domain protein [Rickettsia bellii str. RML Mogi]|uniref:Alkylated DNA repair domain protein n=1 Tax=Rickettsia bellii str. RML Mogi TaxID=1359194 RepID=A0A0F3QGB2_RICBE|nr:alkylated DNA repair domain protein [Rickettsia bellii str. RML Mogi]